MGDGKPSLRIIIREDIETKVDKLLEEYLISAEFFNTKVPPCWKRIVMGVHLISFDKKKNPFNDNTTEGIKYLFASIWRTVCSECENDIFDWFYYFAKAWLVRDPPPIFVDCKCNTHCYY